MGKVFISYSHKDKKWKDRVVKHLGVLEKEDQLTVWDDRQITGGDDWLLEIEQAITTCKVALLLISADFLNSAFILRKEVPKLLELRVSEGIRIIPIIIWDCPWRNVSWLNGSQARPTDGIPLSSFKKARAETALRSLAEEVLHLITTPISNPIQTPSSPPGQLNEETVNSFLTLITSAPLHIAVQNHFKSIFYLKAENPTTEDDFIQRRRDFWNDIRPYQKLLLALLRQYIASTMPTLNSFMVTYEFGRILTENRQGRLAYEVLAPLEDQMRMGQVDVPEHLRTRILDGIGESARFADDFPAAKRLYKAVLEIDPNNHFALKHLGTIFRIENDFPKAKECFEKALNAHKTYHVLFSFGYLYHDLKHYDAAKPKYDECVKALNRLNKKNYYRVYFKLACLHLILKGPTASEDALNNAMQTLKSLKACSQNSTELDDFALITYFAAYLLLALIHSIMKSSLDALKECESFLNRHIDRLTQSAFYCAYVDIERVLAENVDLLPSACIRLGGHAKRLERILDQLQLKHLLFQSSIAQGRIRSLTVATERIDILVRPVETMERESDALKEAMRTFEFPPWRSPNAKHDPLETCKLAVTNIDVAVDSMRDSIESLLDRASVSLYLRSNNKNRIYDGAKVLKPFTAVLPESLRSKHFADHFHVPLGENDTEGMSRIFGKKLMCLDPLTKNRVFINPTVGCSLACEFCYLPEYSIKHNKAPIPAAIDGTTYRQAIAHDNRVSKGKDGALLSLGSFCEPFLPEVANLTVSIMRELKPLGNSIQIATKYFPGISAIKDLIAIFANEPTQLMVNLSLNDQKRWDNPQTKNWLDYSDQICTTIYIKPFLPETYTLMPRFAKLSRDYPDLSFVVGSFYVGESIRQKPSSGFKTDRYLSSPILVSPVVDEPKVIGFEEAEEKKFRKELADMIGRPVFKTASCALSCRRKIMDSLRNYNTPFCIKNYCSNYREKICPSKTTA
jgi:tetratricopeptide (TPR) repeat protein